MAKKLTVQRRRLVDSVFSQGPPKAAETAELHPAESGGKAAIIMNTNPGNTALSGEQTTPPVPTPRPWYLAAENGSTFHGTKGDHRWKCATCPATRTMNLPTNIIGHLKKHGLRAPDATASVHPSAPPARSRARATRAKPAKAEPTSPGEQDRAASPQAKPARAPPKTRKPSPENQRLPPGLHAVTETLLVYVPPPRTEPRQTRPHSAADEAVIPNGQTLAQYYVMKTAEEERVALQGEEGDAGGMTVMEVDDDAIPSWFPGGGIHSDEQAGQAFAQVMGYVRGSDVEGRAAYADVMEVIWAGMMKQPTQ